MDTFQFHFEPHTGWINDPNGLIYFQNKYHAFYQHFPYDIHWGSMHWGHAVSEDLLTWQELPVALTPNESYENAGGCFSGSAIEKDGVLYLMYTAVSKEYGQAQAIATTTDGIHFTKYEGNPVIRHFPEDLGSSDFRDPKLFAYKDEYRVVLGSQFNGRGRVLQYRSEDLLHWECMGVLYEALEYTDPIECPDFFPLGDKWVLMYSKMGNPGYQAQFIVGSYDGTTFTPESYQTPEAGPQFYAPQTFEAEDGRRICIAWFYNWGKQAPMGSQRAGALTLPRELWLEGGKLRTYPVREAWEKMHSVKITEDLTEISTIPGISILVSARKIVAENRVDHQKFTYAGTVQSAEIVEDVKGAELFINGGEFCFTLNA